MSYGIFPPINVKEFPFFAKGDGIADDTAAIQAAITFAFDNGYELFLPAGNYAISSELSTPPSGGTAYGFRMRGTLGFVPDNGGLLGTAEIKATTSMRSCFAPGGGAIDIENIHFNANQNATYGVYLAAATFSTFKRCYASLAIIDGWYVYEADNAVWDECGADSNGTVYCSTAAVVAQYAKFDSVNTNAAVLVSGVAPTLTTDATNAYKVTLSVSSGTIPNFITMGIRKGDILRLNGGVSGSGPDNTAQFYQISGVVSATVLYLANAPLPVVNTAFTTWAISVGDGLHAMAYQVGGEASGNLAMLSVYGGNWQQNACAGVSFGSEFAFSCAIYGAALLSYNLTTGLNAGCMAQGATSTGGFVSDPDGMICLGLFIGPAYFEGNCGYAIMAGNFDDICGGGSTCSPFIGNAYGIQVGQGAGVMTQNASYPFYAGLPNQITIGAGSSNVPQQCYANLAAGFTEFLDEFSSSDTTYQFSALFSFHVFEVIGGNVTLNGTPVITVPSFTQLSRSGSCMLWLWNGAVVGGTSLTISDNSISSSGIVLSGGGSVTIPPHAILALFYDSNTELWYEVSRTGCTPALTNPTVVGKSSFQPVPTGLLIPYAAVNSQVFTAQITTGVATGIVFSIPLPGTTGAPIGTGMLAVDVETSITDNATGAARYKQSMSWNVAQGVVGAMGPMIQYLAIGTFSGLSPSGWSCQLQQSSGPNAQMVVNGGATGTIDISSFTQWTYSK